MPTVTDIPQEECALFDENPTLIKFGEAMGASRFVRMTAIYLLRETLEAAPREAHEDICLAFAEKGGMSVEVLKTDLRWAMKIEQADLLTALEREAITPTDWAERISLGHLRAVGRAAHPSGRQLTSTERVELLIESYHAAYSAAEFEDDLRRRGYLRARASKKRFTAADGAREEEIVMRGREALDFVVRCLSGEFGPMVQTKIARSWERREIDRSDRMVPDSACTALYRLADELRRQGMDLDLSGVLARKGSAPADVAGLLDYLARLYRRRFPGARVSLLPPVELAEGA